MRAAQRGEVRHDVAVPLVPCIRGFAEAGGDYGERRSDEFLLRLEGPLAAAGYTLESQRCGQQES